MPAARLPSDSRSRSRNLINFCTRAKGVECGQALGGAAHRQHQNLSGLNKERKVLVFADLLIVS